MRLSVAQTRQITHTVRQLTGGTAEVYLFGSRLDDNARGGDVDLLIESAAPLGLLQRARIKMELEAKLGLSVDIVEHERDTPATPFQMLARARATRLNAWTAYP
jgi:predicted nucleotidyltransferase